MMSSLVQEARQGLGDAGDKPAPSLLDLLADEQDGFEGPLAEPCPRTNTPARQKGGRPKGSRNKATDELRRLVLSTRRDPLLVLGDIWSCPVEELARRLQCNLIDAAYLQLRAVNTALPFLHRRQPQDVQISGDGLPVVNLQVLDPGAFAAATSQGETGPVIELLPVENGP